MIPHATRAPALPDKPFLYAIIDASLVGARSLTDWVKVLAGDGRAAVVQWRFKGIADDQALSGARELRAALPHGEFRASVIDTLKRGGRA